MVDVEPTAIEQRTVGYLLGIGAKLAAGIDGFVGDAGLARTKDGTLYLKHTISGPGPSVTYVHEIDEAGAFARCTTGRRNG